VPTKTIAKFYLIAYTGGGWYSMFVPGSTGGVLIVGYIIIAKSRKP